MTVGLGAFGAWGLIAPAPQAIILGSILGVTGIPPTEAQSIRSKGDAYRTYRNGFPSSYRGRGAVIGTKPSRDRSRMTPGSLPDSSPVRVRCS